MTVLDELQPYIDSIGLVQDKPQFRLSGNGICFTAEAALTMVQNGEDPKLMVQGIIACLLEPGLYRRHVDPRAFSEDHESVDDYIGLALISFLTNPQIAKDILAYGRSHIWIPPWWSYPLLLIPFILFWEDPRKYFYATGDDVGTNDVSAWLGRFPSLICALQWAAGETPGLGRRVWFWSSLLLTTCNDNNNARRSRMLCHFRPNSLAAKGYRDSMRMKWAPEATLEEAFQIMYEDYFQIKHPIGERALQ